MNLNDVVVGALIAIFGASLLSIFRYWVTNRVESKQWEREQRAQEIERIDKAAAEVTNYAAHILARTNTHDPARSRQAQGDLRASFARWDMLLNPHCTEDEREEIQKRSDFLHSENKTRAGAESKTVIEITHSVKARLIEDTEKPRWKFW